MDRVHKLLPEPSSRYPCKMQINGGLLTWLICNTLYRPEQDNSLPKNPTRFASYQYIY